MECPDRTSIDRYLGGAATEAESARLETHFAGCAACGAAAASGDSDGLLQELREACAGDASRLQYGARHATAVSTPDLERYRILRPIGEGGMGIVYEAEQRSPRRRVALKVLRPLLAGPKALDRFRLEADALGRLDHPGIARIHEAGTFDTGSGPQPFFAMELVDGRPVDLFANEGGLGIRDRVALAARIADAVQHAHQKGVIHRDLKPSNILVDDSGRPRILDFGVARILGEERDDATAAGQLVGTVRYMSPEQVRGDPAGIDVRSDVHALGLLLFELLAGRPPYELEGKSVPGMAAEIAEAAPLRLGALDRRFRGDLDAIAARALEKDKERLYPSAAALAEDLRRWLAHEPVAARPPSTFDQARNFARRNRKLTAALAALVLTLAAGVVATTLEAARADRAAADARESESTARSALEEARFRLDQSEQVFELLNDVFVQANPEIRVGPEPTLREAVEQAARRLEAGKYGPRVEGAARAMIGQLFLTFGARDAARTQLETALALLEGDAGVESVKTLTYLAELGKEEDDLATAERFQRRAVEAAARLPARFREWDRRTRVGLARILVARARFDEAEPLLAAALVELRRIGVPTRELGIALMNLALVRRNKGDDDAAETLMVEALEIRRQACGDGHLEVADTLHGLSGILFGRGEFEEAEEHAARVLEIRKTQLGDRHRDVAVARMRLGTIQLKLRRKAEAAENLRLAHEIARESSGPAHTTTVAAASLMASLMQAADPGAAERLLRDSWTAVQEAGAEKSAAAMALLEGLEDLLVDQGRREEALAVFAEHSETASKHLPDDSALLANVRLRHGWCLGTMGRNEEAERNLLAALRTYEAVPGGRHPALAKVYEALAVLYAQWERPDDAAVYRGRLAAFREAGR